MLIPRTMRRDGLVRCKSSKGKWKTLRLGSLSTAEADVNWTKEDKDKALNAAEEYQKGGMWLAQFDGSIRL